MIEYYVQWWNNVIGAWITIDAHKPLAKHEAIKKCAEANADLPPLGMRRRVVEVIEIRVPTAVTVRHYYSKEGWTVLKSFPYLPNGWQQADELFFELVKKDPNNAFNYDVKEVY